ncbi:MAG: serine hydrolase domain-containing protein [Myxococcota bacterium]
MWSVLVAGCGVDPSFVQPSPLSLSGHPGAGGSADPGQQVLLRDPRFDPARAVLGQELLGNLGRGVSVAVWERGELVWVEGVGSRDPFDTTGRAGVTGDTVFQLGEVSRVLTAASALQGLARSGSDLDLPLSAALQEFELAADPTWSDRATVRDLLTEQSGLYDYLDWVGSTDDRDLAAWHYGFYATELWAMNEPGKVWNPSNPNSGLLALLAEESDPAGRYFADVLTEELARPLGMDRTFARKADAQAEDFALSTGVGRADTFGYADIPMDEVPDPAYQRPGMLLWSTPADLCRFGAFLLHGDPAVLDDALRREIGTPHASTHWLDDHQHAGFGLRVSDQLLLSDGYHPISVWEQRGNTHSFTARFVVLPDSDAVIAILSNGYNDEYTATFEAIVRTLEPLLPAATYAPTIDKQVVPSLAGSYMDASNLGPIEVTEGGTYGLQIAIPELLDFDVEPDLVPVTTERWSVTIGNVPFDLTFVPDDTGTYRWVSNHLFVGTR